MGAFLKEMPKATGARGNPGGQGAEIVRSSEGTTQTLAEIGITKKQSATAQKLANIPDQEFRERIASLQRCGLSSAREGQDSAPQ